MKTKKEYNYSLYYSVTNEILISPLLQLQIRCFVPSVFCVGRLVSPFLIVQSIKYSSQLPTIEPEMLPFFVVNEIVEPACMELILMSPPFEFNVRLFCIDRSDKVIFSLVVEISKFDIKFMEEFLSISKTAKIVGMTSETLRHYDRIGLVKPSKIDEWTNYRYYSSQDIVRLNIIKALQCMGLSLEKIKEILELKDFSKIVELLRQAENSAEEKIKELNSAKTKIQRARQFYESKLEGNNNTNSIFVKELPSRVILLSKDLTEPTINNLYDYHRHYYSQIKDKDKDKFSFEDIAGIYETKEDSRLFAVSIKYKDDENLKVLPKGKYLCADCTDENRDVMKEKLLNMAKEELNINPEYIIEIIVLSGILQWNYQIQIPIENN